MQITEILYSACDILTGMEERCKGLVDRNLADVINLLVNEYFNPQEVCDYLYLCP